jgi:hypothetical protein
MLCIICFACDHVPSISMMVYGSCCTVATPTALVVDLTAFDKHGVMSSIKVASSLGYNTSGKFAALSFVVVGENAVFNTG